MDVPKIRAIPPLNLKALSHPSSVGSEKIPEYPDDQVIELCQKLFMSAIDDQNEHFIHFKEALQETESEVLDNAAIPRSLACEVTLRKVALIEKVCLNCAKQSPNFKVNQSRSAPITFCLEHLDETYSYLARFIHSQIGKSYTREDIRDILGDFENAKNTVLRKKEIANDYLIAIGEKDDVVTAHLRCQDYLTRGIDRDDPLIQKLKNRLGEIHCEEVSYPQIPYFLAAPTKLKSNQREIVQLATELLTSRNIIRSIQPD